MKNMKIAISLLIIILAHFGVYSQDTIFFKNAGKIIVIVKEVAQTEVQYKKAELPDGPMYIISKNDIEKIVYKNGYTEIIKKVEVANTNNNYNSQTFEIYKSPENINMENINMEKITYHDAKRRHSSIVTLVDRHPDPSRRSTLLQSARSIKSFKRHQDGTRTGAIIFGGVAIGGIAVYTLASAVSYNNNPDPIFAGPPVVFGTLAVILGAASVSFNINLKKKRNDFVSAYNQ